MASATPRACSKATCASGTSSGSRNAKVDEVEPGNMSVEEVNEDGSSRQTHELPFTFSMMLPAFRGVAAVRGIEGLTNPRGFIIVDKHQRNPAFPNIFSVGVCVAIPPVGKTPLPVGVPKTGFMIESMVTATAEEYRRTAARRGAAAVATWNAVCLADFGDEGIAFVAQPQIPPRNVNWSPRQVGARGQSGVREILPAQGPSGKSETFYERWHSGTRHRQAQDRRARQMNWVHVAYYSDVLCIWAYVAQARVDEVRAVFGDEVLLAHRRNHALRRHRRQVQARAGATVAASRVTPATSARSPAGSRTSSFTPMPGASSVPALR